MHQKRVAAIHDISCFGKCSLTVALPILSAAGIETAVIPTAVLSTHTGGFGENTFRDLTEDILPVAKHWRKAGITVDAVYTGYLGSREQIAIVKKVIDLISAEDTLVIVDPVMADNGQLYKGFESDFPKEMRKLCRKANVITPNITEAALMLNMPYNNGPLDETYVETILSALHAMTGGSVVLTGVYFDERRVGAATFDGSRIDYAFSERVPASYHGTGDIFSSALVSAMLSGRSLKASAQIAANFTSGCIKRTHQDYPYMTYGVNFESEIPTLIKYLEL